MLRIVTTLILTMMYLITGGVLSAGEHVTGIDFSSGYSGNVFYDSAGLSDTYGAPTVHLAYYPSEHVEISGYGSYVVYSSLSDLSNFSGGGALTVIAGRATSPLSAYLSTRADLTAYGTAYGLYDAASVAVDGALQFRLATPIVVKTGASFAATRYSADAIGDNAGVGIFAGCNLTLPGRNSLNMEAGYDVTRFTGLEDALPTGVGRGASGLTLTDELTTVYYTARFSRPLGDHSGFSLSASGRRFVDSDATATYGLTISYLSPWSDFWEGQSLESRIKTFLVPGAIVYLGGHLQRRTFMAALESDEAAATYVLHDRRDDRAGGFFRIERPLFSASQTPLTPAAEIAFRHNDSSDNRYDYSFVSLSLSISLRF